MKKKNIKELYGPGGTFYSGRYLGTSGADSGFSSYMSNKKAYPDHDDPTEEEEEEMANDILQNRKKRIGGYSVQETMRSLNESAIGSAVETLLTDILAGAADELTGEAAGIVLLIPGMVKNLIEIYSVGSDIDEILDSVKMETGDSEITLIYTVDQSHINKLKPLVAQQSQDVSEFFATIIRALPVPAGIDSAVAAFLNQISQPAIGTFSEAYQGLMGRMPNILRSIMEMSSAPVGGPIIFNALRRIYKVNNLKPGRNHFDSSGNLIDDTQTSPGLMLAQPSDQFDASSFSANLPPPEEFKRQVDAAFKQSLAESLRRKSLMGILQEFDEGIHEDDVEEGNCGPNEMHCVSEDDVSEISMGGVPGVGMKIGHNPDGTPTTRRQLKKLRKAQDIYNEGIRHQERWSTKTSGRIKFK